MNAATAAVFGAGAWGAALSLALARAGRTVMVWGRNREAMAEAEETRRFPRLTMAEPSDAIRFTADVAAAAAAPLWVLATPAQTVGETAARLRPHARQGVCAVCAAKGVDRASGRLQTDILKSVLPEVTATALSGPGFAHDVAGGLPFAATVAGDTIACAEWVAEAFRSDGFRPYASDDLVGVQLGGALKNVYAIAAGAVVGARLGESARAGLIARGFAEMRRLAEARGARAETLMGLSGLGDLVLTATSERSRNYALGLRLGRGEPLDKALAASKGVAEGVATARAVVAMAEVDGIEAPIAHVTQAVLSGAMTVGEAGAALFARPLKQED